MQEATKPNTRSVNIATEVYERIAAIAASEDRTVGKQLERILKKAMDQDITG